MQSVQKQFKQVASSWTKLMLNRNKNLEIRIFEFFRCKANYHPQKYQYHRPELVDVDRKQAVPFLTREGFTYYTSNGSFDVDKSSGASRRSFLRPNLTFFQVSCRTFKTLRDKQADETRNPSVFNRIKNMFPQIGTAGTNTATNLTPTDINALLSDLPASEAMKVKMLIAEGLGYIAANSCPSDSQYNPYRRSLRRLRIVLAIFAICIAFLCCLNYLIIIGSSEFGTFGGGNEIRPEDVNVNFGDVKGVDEAKSEMQEIVEFLRNPNKFIELGGKLPKGVLLVGPPGTGKTLLARAVAGEAGVPFFHAAGPEFEERFVGLGASRVRDLFKAAKAKGPCVIFIDEIDSIGAKRTNSMHHPYANQTINQLLSEMDGFRQNEGVIVIGATNRKEALDTALLRPGRFDVHVQVPPPGLSGRKEILEYYLSKVKRGNDVDVEALVRRSQGFTGADLENMVNQAALRAAIESAKFVGENHLEFAYDKLIMGPEIKSRIPDKETNLITAYHEGGHALVALYTKQATPLHKITIIPRGSSLGHTSFLPTKEQYDINKEQLLAEMDTSMGGRAAEELTFGIDKITGGASQDLQHATSIATDMVEKLGMSEKVGLRTVKKDGNPTSDLINEEINRLLQESYDRAKAILVKHAKELHTLAQALIMYETLDADDVKCLLSQGLNPSHGRAGVVNSQGQGTSSSGSCGSDSM